MLELFSWVLASLRALWHKLHCAIGKWQHKFHLQSSSNTIISTVSSRFNGRYGKSLAIRLNDSTRTLPTARGLPLIGTFVDLLTAGGAPQLHKYIDQRHQELGVIFHERLGGVQDAIFVSSASLMRAVFLHEGQHPRHPLPDAWTIYNKKHNCQRGLFFMEGAEWLHNRRILNRFLLSGNLHWMNAPIEACTTRLIDNWKHSVAEHANAGRGYFELPALEQQLYRWAIDVICAIMFGYAATTSKQMEAPLQYFSLIVHKIFDTSSALMNFPPQLAQRFRMRIWREFESAVAAVLQQGCDVIDKFVALSTSPSPEGTAESKMDSNEVLFEKLKNADTSLETIKRIFVDLVIAAGDTTAYTTEWALYLLTQHTQLQQRLAQAVARHDGESDILVHGLIKETLRLYPIAPFIGRYLATDANIGGYNIKKNSLVLLSLYTAGREATHFPDPLAVKPERWRRNEETGELQEVLQSHGSLPFAIGNRSCIGRRVALKQIHSLLSRVVSTFQLQCNNVTAINCILRLVTVPDQPLQLALQLRDSV